MTITITQPTQVTLEVQTPAYYKFGLSYMYLQDENTGIRLLPSVFGSTEITYGKMYPELIQLFSTQGEKVTYEQFTEAYEKAIDELGAMLSGQLQLA